MKNLNLETIEKDELLKINGGLSWDWKVRYIVNELTGSSPSWDACVKIWNS
jgi:hypothetical protein